MPKNINKGHTGNPVVDSLIVLFGIYDIIVDFVRVIRFAGFVPCAHVNTDSEAVRQQLLRGLDVNVSGCRRGGRMEVRVMRSKLATEGYITRRQQSLQKKFIVPTIHATGNLASLLVTPADRGEISLVVHETTVEVRLDIWVGRCDVDLSSNQ